MPAAHMNAATALVNRVLLAIGRLPGVRAFRVNTGQAWQGSKVVRNKDGTITIHDPRPIHAGLVTGGSDVIGWRSIVVEPEHVGRRVAVFAAIEVKSGAGRPTDDQARFLATVQAAGGFAGVARSEGDALRIIGTRNVK